MVDSRFDLIVIGGGTAGLPAAIAAAERGLSVAIVEAGDELGGALHLSSGSISAAATSIQERHGVADSADKHFEDCLRINHGTGDHALLRRWTNGAAQTVEWLESIGWTCSPEKPVLAPEHDLYATPRTYRSTKNGPGLLEAFAPLIEKCIQVGLVTVFLSARFENIVFEANALKGVTVRKDGRQFPLFSGDVLISTGGYSANELCFRALHGFVPVRYACATARGDALTAITEVGGFVRYAEHVLPTFGATRDLTSPASAWIHSNVIPSLRKPWEVYINLSGERFMAEDEERMHQRERALGNQPEWSFWVIYDQHILNTAPPLFFHNAAALAELFATHEDYIIADSLSELATACMLPLEALRKSIDLYNRGQAVGSDMLGRNHLPAPVKVPPFYAVKHYGTCICSVGGIAVNPDLTVMRSDGSVIPGLFAAGEVLGSGVFGHAFLSGSIVSAAVTFGREIGHAIGLKHSR